MLGVISSLLEDIRPTAVIFVDLDNFKAVNDSFGHPEGDKCLERVAELIGSVVLGKGTLYRYGGDEFVVVLPNFESSEAAATGERIRKAIDEGKISASVGVVSSCESQTTDASCLIKAADDAMYSSKKSGRNYVTIWKPSLVCAGQ